METLEDSEANHQRKRSNSKTRNSQRSVRAPVLIVVVAYDIYSDRLRDKARRLLLRYGLSRISKSVYAGRINWETAKEIAFKLSQILEGEDSAVVIPVSEKDFLRAIAVSAGAVAERKPSGARVVG